MRAGKTWFVVVFGVGFLLLGRGPLCAQDALEEISKHLFTPELLKTAQEVIGLTPEQVDAVKQELAQAHDEFAQLKHQLQAELVALATLVREKKPDEKAVLAKSDEVLEIERRIKQRHLALLVRIKNVLTVEQQVKLTEIRTGIQAKQTLQAKLEEVKQKGGDVSVLQQLKSDLAPLLEAERFREAEAVLDKTLRQLNQDTKRDRHEARQ